MLTRISMPTTLPQVYRCSSLAASSWRIPLLELCLVYAQPPECLRISLCCLINGMGTHWSPGKDCFVSYLGHVQPLTCDGASLKTHYLECVCHKNVGTLSGLKWFCCFCFSICCLCFGRILYGDG